MKEQKSGWWYVARPKDAPISLAVHMFEHIPFLNNNTDAKPFSLEHGPKTKTHTSARLPSE